jgi:general secretion pathway protein I
MPRERGFTLLEVAVALLVLGLAAAALFRGAGAGLGATALAARSQEAVVRAKSHLALAVDGGQLHAGTFTGDDGGGFRWSLRVVPVQAASSRGDQPAAPRATSSPPVVLYSISCAIGWTEGLHARQVVLTTEQVGPP